MFSILARTTSAYRHLHAMKSIPAASLSTCFVNSICPRMMNARFALPFGLRLVFNPSASMVLSIGIQKSHCMNRHSARCIMDSRAVHCAALHWGLAIVGSRLATQRLRCCSLSQVSSSLGVQKNDLIFHTSAQLMGPRRFVHSISAGGGLALW